MPTPDLTGLTFDNALDRVEAMECPEDQARTLIHHACLLSTKRGADFMKRIATQATPWCRKLYEILRARDAEKARRKAERDRKKSLIKPARFVPPNLFDLFGAAQSEDLDEKAK